MVPLVRRQRCVELAEHVPAVRVNLTGSAAAFTVMNTPPRYNEPTSSSRAATAARREPRGICTCVDSEEHSDCATATAPLPGRERPQPMERHPERALAPARLTSATSPTPRRPLPVEHVCLVAPIQMSRMQSGPFSDAVLGAVCHSGAPTAQLAATNRYQFPMHPSRAGKSLPGRPPCACNSPNVGGSASHLTGKFNGHDPAPVCSMS
jgi:hypothetical protein